MNDEQQVNVAKELFSEGVGQDAEAAKILSFTEEELIHASERLKEKSNRTRWNFGGIGDVNNNTQSPSKMFGSSK